MSLVAYLVLFSTAVVVHIICTGKFARFRKRANASSRLWPQITQNKLFHRLAFTLQGIIVNIQAAPIQKAVRLRISWTTCAQRHDCDLRPAVVIFLLTRDFHPGKNGLPLLSYR